MTVCLALAALMAWCQAGALAEGEQVAGKVPIDLTAIVNAVIALIGAVITYRLVPWLKARTTQTQQSMMKTAVKTAVYAAEQLYKTGAVQDRLAYAQDVLKKQGYTVDRSEIEAQVKDMQALAGVLEIGEGRIDE